LERLRNIVPEQYYDQCARSFDNAPAAVVRVNTLKRSVADARKMVDAQNLTYELSGDVGEAVCFPGVERGRIPFLTSSPDIFYQQSLSSMLPVAALDPQPQERILDLCAAPGSKTSFMAARMNNTGTIVAVETVRQRLYKLKSVLELLGVTNTECLCLDGRRFSARGNLFDRVLADVPCSSEGRFQTAHPKTFAYWSPRKIKEMVRKQRGLLLNAGRQVKSGGVLVYSTCTFAPEENEGVADWFLRKTDGQFTVDAVEFKEIPTYPACCFWEKKEYDPQVLRCVRVLPGRLTEGFFIAKFRKL